MIHMQETTNTSSKKLKIASIIAGSIVAALVIFVAGVNVGIHKAKFSYKFGENYERNFMNPGMMNPGGPNGQMGMGQPGFPDRIANFPDRVEGKNFRNPHGISGTIISISDNSLVIKDKDNKENSVAISDQTVIKSGRDDIKISDLKTNDQIVVIGKPGDDGKVNADFIRIFDGESTDDK